MGGPLPARVPTRALVGVVKARGDPFAEALKRVDAGIEWLRCRGGCGQEYARLGRGGLCYHCAKKRAMASDPLHDHKLRAAGGW